MPIVCHSIDMIAHRYTAPVLAGDDPTEAYYDADTKVTLGSPLPLPAPYPPAIPPPSSTAEAPPFPPPR
ncbi:hypothetical protein ABB07_24805 [Streptomyces incarnatus]|uniref:Uncharacterized protein n=1 Tax=Streptomyces incarnatus TaxID=665007 RepID=A0ABN4GHM7_9ACTN|nr:hypothetical protein ABB07_24805 [Streptomyces incarnatus]